LLVLVVGTREVHGGGQVGGDHVNRQGLVVWLIPRCLCGRILSVVVAGPLSSRFD
jgi:hypothetical protein